MEIEREIVANTDEVIGLAFVPDAKERALQKKRNIDGDSDENENEDERTLCETAERSSRGHQLAHGTYV